LVEGRECADALVWAGGVAVGRGVADRGARVAGGSRGAGCAGVGSGAAGADRGALAARGRRDTAGGADGWAADDRDRDLRALDGAQAALSVGISDADGRGVGLDSPAALLSDRAVGAGARRVDDPQADRADRGRDGRRAHARVDRQGDARAALPRAGGADRLDGGRGRRAARPTASSSPTRRASPAGSRTSTGSPAGT
jgi:hypothetical protein